MEKVSFLVEQTGESALRIVGNYWQGSTSRGVLLLHMMPAGKESWNDFAYALNRVGFYVLAIDLRGHGESRHYEFDHKSLEIDFTKFTDEDHQASIKDVEGAINFLSSKKLQREHITIGGASIGANLALWYTADHLDIRSAFLLSPGLNYKGILADHYMKKTRSSQKIFMSAASDDPYSKKSVEALTPLGLSEKTNRLFESGGHGTKLLEARPELADDILRWLQEA